MDFNPNSKYYLPISPIGGAGLSPDTVTAAMTDGRMASWWYQIILAKHFTNLKLVDDRGRDFITKDAKQLSYEQRMLPLESDTLFMSLSAHQGAGRDFSLAEFEENTKRNSGLIVVVPHHDYTNLIIATLTTKQILKYASSKGQMSRNDLYRIIGNPQTLYTRGFRLANGQRDQMIEVT